MAAVTQSPPRREIGAQSQIAGPDGWSSFIDEAEYVPELGWPQSIFTYHRMRSDSQLEALHLGTTLPVREYRWSIDPNGAPALLAEQAAADLGLPITGHEEDNVARSAAQFNFDQFLEDALLGPLYGHMHFEIVGGYDPDMRWRLGKLAPRHPRTIQDFRTTNTGELLAIRQNIAGAVAAGQGGLGWRRLPEPIPASSLLAFVWRREAGSHVGRSMLRSLYREWLVKDRTIRVAAINLERAGGVPVIEGPAGASDAALGNLAALARQFKVAEGGGGAIPFGSKLHLVGGNVPDAIALLEYCDQAMARVWSLMLMLLGQTKTGSRALGGEFSDYAARTQRALAGWVQAIVNDFLDRYTSWNPGGNTTKYAPRLRFEQTKPENLSTEEFVALINAGALTVDPELEGWLRGENGLPDKPEGEPVSPVANGGTAPTNSGDATPGTTGDGGVQAPDEVGVQAAGRRLFRREVSASAGSLPDRSLRRQTYEQEVRAAVDFRTLDIAHETVVANVEGLYLDSILPGSIEALASGVLTTQAGTPRTRLTRAAMASLSAPSAGRDELAAHLVTAARSGAAAAVTELAGQGYHGAEVPDDETLAGLVGDQADAVASMAANGLSLAAQRKAQGLVGGGRSPADVAAGVRTHLASMKHTWTLDQLRGAVTMAQNAGRQAVFASGPQESILYYASEILDVNCCDACSSVDGTEYPDLQAAEQDYPSGGFVECAGGPRCRGTLVAVYAEQNPLSSSDPFTAALS